MKNPIALHRRATEFSQTVIAPITMKPEDAQEDFEQRIDESGIDITDLTLAQGLRLMLDFYRDTRAEGCVLRGRGRHAPLPMGHL